MVTVIVALPAATPVTVTVEPEIDAVALLASDEETDNAPVPEPPLTVNVVVPVPQIVPLLDDKVNAACVPEPQPPPAAS